MLPNPFGTRIISANAAKSIWNTYNTRKCSQIHLEHVFRPDGTSRPLPDQLDSQPVRQSASPSFDQPASERPNQLFSEPAIQLSASALDKHIGRAGPRPQGAAPRARERFETCFLCRFWCSSKDANMSTSRCRAYQDITWKPIPSHCKAGCNKRCNEAAMQPAIYLPTSYLGSTLVSSNKIRLGMKWMVVTKEMVDARGLMLLDAQSL